LRVVCDIEGNGLNPTRLWCIVAKDIDTGDDYEFTQLTENPEFLAWAQKVTHWAGHHFLGYDAPALRKLCNLDIPYESVTDTLVVSRLVDATLSGKKPHSIEAWGDRLGFPKPHADLKDWSVYHPEMLERCRGDVEITYRLYKHFEGYLTSELWKPSLDLEHFVADFCNTLHINGFGFDAQAAETLRDEIQLEVTRLETAMQAAFGVRIVPGKEIHPKNTKHNTLNRSDFRWVTDGDLTIYVADAPFTRISYEPFNPASPQQRIDELWKAGWRPINKTKGHSDAEKELRTLRRKRRKSADDVLRITELTEKLGEYGLSGYGYSGWSSSDEENLNTLPDDAPGAARLISRYAILNNRLSVLNKQWIPNYVPETGRIHGSFSGIGAWTHRMSHDRPNMGNVPKFDTKQPHKTPYSDRMRSLWVAGRDKFLVGVDAESIQLRIFGHYLDDQEFIDALIKGDKSTGTDPHSVNQRALGAPCRSRDDAKTFIYAWLLGAGVAKVANILGCTREEAAQAVENFIHRYPGLKYLKEKVIPIDAERGYFRGFDGRYVRIFGDDSDSRNHFALAGYLQNGEKIVMARAAKIWYPRLTQEKIDFLPVNLVHDEFQIETKRDVETALYVARTVADAIRQAGDDLNLRCPMAGSILSEHGRVIDGQRLAIGDNWYQTH
jgi:DNA polymerase-1